MKISPKAAQTFAEDESFSDAESDAQSLPETTVTGDATGSSEKVEGFELAKGETRTVNLLRATLALVLILAATTVSIFVYKFTSSQETQDFEIAFHGHRTKVIESLKLNVERMLASMDAFTTNMNAFAYSQERSYPFVTLPGKFSKIVALSDVKLNPIGTDCLGVIAVTFCLKALKRVSTASCLKSMVCLF